MVAPGSGNGLGRGWRSRRGSSAGGVTVASGAGSGKTVDSSSPASSRSNWSRSIVSRSMRMMRDPVQLLHVLAEHCERELVRLLDHAADLVVDLAGDLLGVVGLGAVVAAEERLVVAAAEHARAELLAHAERMIIDFDVAVTFSRSFAAPVVTSWKTISSAARPPSVIAIWCISALRVVR